MNVRKANNEVGRDLVEGIDTPAAVEKYTGIPVSTLAQWRYLKKGPNFIRAGRMIRYRKEDVDQWLEDQTVKVGSDD